MKKIFIGVVEDLPTCKPIESPVRRRKPREVPRPPTPPKVTRSGRKSIARLPQPSPSKKTEKRPSHVEYAVSGTSTPKRKSKKRLRASETYLGTNSPKSKKRLRYSVRIAGTLHRHCVSWETIKKPQTQRRPGSASPSRRRWHKPQEIEVDASGEETRDDATKSAAVDSQTSRTPSSSFSELHPLKHDENTDVTGDIFYGSEDDSETEDEEEVCLPILVPRTARMFLSDYTDEEQNAVDTSTKVSFQWPPPIILEFSSAEASQPKVVEGLISDSESSSTEGTQPAVVKEGLIMESSTTEGSRPVVIEEGILMETSSAEESQPDEVIEQEIIIFSEVEEQGDDQPDQQVPSGPTYGPEQKFDFTWTGFPQSPIPPELRREPFSDIDCGPTVPLAHPYEAFIAIWDRDIMEHIVVETNRYAQQAVSLMWKDGTLRPNSRITKWKDTDVDELYVFFAVILATGVVAKTRLDEYWNSGKDIFMTPGFSASMSFNRFILLNRCIHFNDNEGCNPETMTRAHAKLYKMQPILDHLNTKFSQLYNLSQNIALDESLTMWKGWLSINQFINNKQASVGIKTYEVCESQTGYLWRLEVHAGRENPDPQVDSPVSGVIPSLVLRLLNGLEHKGHTIWMDNYYNSPALARELKTRGFDCVGTLRTNRQFVPTELAKLTKANMAVGQVCGCTAGDVDLVVWRDNNRVALISTYHGLATVNNGDQLKPSIIPDYNICMGGVDRKDQMLAMYPVERRRNRVWYKKFFRRLLNASVLNAYILLRAQQQITHRTFRKTLVQQLLTRHGPQAPSRVLPPSPPHWPAQYDLTSTGLARLRRVCAVCKTRTKSYCKGCDVALCVFTCFERHHLSIRGNPN